MLHQQLRDELSDLRIQILRLQHRAADVQRQLSAPLAEEEEGHAIRRPGWPIRRLPQGGGAMH